MIDTKVIRNRRTHITRADYDDTKPILGLDNVAFPNFNSLRARVLRRLFPSGKTLSHREFDYVSHSYRLAGYIGVLRDKGWPIVDHDEIAQTNDPVPGKAKFTRYQLFTAFTAELEEKIRQFCKAVDEFEALAAATAKAQKHVSHSAEQTQVRL